MRLFFLTQFVIGSIDDQILILTNQQVVPMGFKIKTIRGRKVGNTEGDKNVLND